MIPHLDRINGHRVEAVRLVRVNDSVVRFHAMGRYFAKAGSKPTKRPRHLSGILWTIGTCRRNAQRT